MYDKLSKRLLSTLALVSMAGLALSGCGGDPLAEEGGGGGASVAADTISIGSANFPENELLAEMYAQILEAEGVEVERNFNIGARDLYLAALEDGSIDLLPEYNGALYSSLVEGGAPEGVTSPEEVYEALQEVLPEGIITLEQSEAEDKDTLAVLPKTAEKYGLETIDDLAPIASDLSMAAGPEWAERFQGLLGLKELYGIEFGEFQPLDAGGPLTREALLSGQADVANLFSTDSVIETEGLIILEDTENLYLSENIVPIIREAKVTDAITTALNELSAALTTENLTEYLAMVQVDKQSSADVAAAFIKEYGP